MHKLTAGSNNRAGVKIMEKKKETPLSRELLDQPVPPVKGAVTQMQDVVLRPGQASPAERTRMEAVLPTESWL